MRPQPITAILNTFARHKQQCHQIATREAQQCNLRQLCDSERRQQRGKKIREIAERKMEDLNANDVEAAMKIVEGTARSMGIEVTN